jgi:hypothetical protein
MRAVKVMNICGRGAVWGGNDVLALKVMLKWSSVSRRKV